MFLTPKLFDFNIYKSVPWPGKFLSSQSIHLYSDLIDLVLNIRFFLNPIVRQPLHEYHPSNRLNVRHLPTLPISKYGALNTSGIRSSYSSSMNELFLRLFAVPSTSTSLQQVPAPILPKKLHSKSSKYGVDSIHTKPRTITIVKQGNEKPHRTITILLNRRTIQTYDQLLGDISESFGYQKNRSDKVRRNKKMHWNSDASHFTDKG